MHVVCVINLEVSVGCQEAYGLLYYASYIIVIYGGASLHRSVLCWSSKGVFWEYLHAMRPNASSRVSTLYICSRRAVQTCWSVICLGAYTICMTCVNKIEKNLRWVSVYVSLGRLVFSL